MVDFVAIMSCLNPTGPIDNSDFLCRHGGVLPQKTEHVYDLCVAFPQPVWDLLHSQFGGGPACTRYNNFYLNVTVRLMQIQYNFLTMTYLIMFLVWIWLHQLICNTYIQHLLFVGFTSVTSAVVTLMH
jgi:hypothetical protein